MVLVASYGQEGQQGQYQQASRPGQQGQCRSAGQEGQAKGQQVIKLAGQLPAGRGAGSRATHQEPNHQLWAQQASRPAGRRSG
jgi:hypothetical protein